MIGNHYSFYYFVLKSDTANHLHRHLYIYKVGHAIPSDSILIHDTLALCTSHSIFNITPLFCKRYSIHVDSQDLEMLLEQSIQKITCHRQIGDVRLGLMQKFRIFDACTEKRHSLQATKTISSCL